VLSFKKLKIIYKKVQQLFFGLLYFCNIELLKKCTSKKSFLNINWLHKNSIFPLKIDYPLNIAFRIHQNVGLMSVKSFSNLQKDIDITIIQDSFIVEIHQRR